MVTSTLALIPSKSSVAVAVPVSLVVTRLLGVILPPPLALTMRRAPGTGAPVASRARAVMVKRLVPGILTMGSTSRLEITWMGVP